MKTSQIINEDLWTMNHKNPLLLTLHLPGISPISGFRERFTLNVKGISTHELERKCSELRNKIRTLTFDCFFNELIID